MNVTSNTGDFTENPNECVGCIIQDALICLSGATPLLYRVSEICPDCGKQRQIESFSTFIDANQFIIRQIKKDAAEKVVFNYNIEQIRKAALN